MSCAKRGQPRANEHRAAVCDAEAHGGRVAPDAGVEALEESAHAPERLDRDQLDAVVVGEGLDLLSGLEAELLLRDPADTLRPRQHSLVGAQGGDAVATVRAGLRMQGGAVTGPIIVNSSRAILYASADADFAAAARRVALRTRDELEAARIA